MITSAPVRVIGIGSPHGDDAIGWKVVAELQRVFPPQPRLDYHYVDGGQRLLDLLDGVGSLILIDAMATQDIPGTIKHFNWPDDRIESIRAGSTHDLGPVQALKLAECLQFAPESISVFGIAGSEFQGESLSPELVESLPQIVNQLKVVLESHLAKMEQSCMKPPS